MKLVGWDLSEGRLISVGSKMALKWCVFLPEAVCLAVGSCGSGWKPSLRGALRKGPARARAELQTLDASPHPERLLHEFGGS